MSDGTHRSRETYDPDATRFIDELREGFVGRERELAELEGQLDQVRLLNVFGPPGVGKSRLCRVLVRSSGAHAVCELGSVTEVIEAARILGERLGAAAPPQEEPLATRRRLTRALKEAEPRVVLLDDADRVAGLEEFLDEIVAQGPSLTFVVTTRTRLHVKAARHFGLEGLSVDSGRQLFVETASRRSIGFRAGDETMEAVDELVRTVDGLPLAIELAAARTTVMSPQELLRRSSSKLDLLKRSRSTNPRHLSLRAALDSSWEQLEEAQQHCLAGCSVFTHPFQLAAAEFVSGPFVDGFVPDVLESLIESSLVQTEFATDHVRFSMLTCVREYAAERLDDYDWGEAVSDRRAEFLLQQAMRLAAEMEGSGGRRAFLELNRLRDPYVATLRELVDQSRWTAAADLLTALRWNILLRGPLREYQDLLRMVVERAEIGASLRRRVATILCEAMVMLGERLAAAERVERELDSMARDDDPRTWMRLGRVWAMAYGQQRPDAARERLEAALRFARDQGDRFMQARLLERLGFLDIQSNDVDRAWLRFADAREILRALGAELFVSESTTGLGYIELRRGQIGAALELFGEAVQIHDAAANDFHAAAARFNLGVAQHAAGQLEKARVNFHAALRTWRVGGFVHYRVPGMVRLALVYTEEGRHAEARSTFSEALQLGSDTSDHHNAAIAYVERAALDASVGRPVDVTELERMAAGILVGADPDAFASALTLFVSVAAESGIATLPYVNRLEELVSLFADDDTYVRSVVRRLRDIARAFHALAQARARDDENAARQHIARAFEWAGDLLEDSEEARVSNPYVRLWTARLREATADLPDFGPAAETFRGVLLLHRGGDWYRLDDRPPVDLTTRRPLRLIMRRLAQVADEHPGDELDVDALAAAGWPGETLGLSTRRNRVYTAIRFLREMDLEELLVTGDTGYHFAADVAVRLTDEALPSG